MTVLSVIQGATSRLTLPRPDEIVGVTDVGTAQFLELLTEECESLHKDHDWSDLITVRTFTGIAGYPQTNEFPADFARLTEGVEIWNTSNDWPLQGPITPSDWSALVVQAVATVPQYWRNIAGVLNIFTNAVDQTFRYEYVSKNWCLTGGVTPASTITTDDDTFVFPEELLKIAVRWRWKQAKALDYAEDMGTYERMKASFILQDKGGTTSFSTMRPMDSDNAAVRRTWPGSIIP